MSFASRISKSKSTIKIVMGVWLGIAALVALQVQVRSLHKQGGVFRPFNPSVASQTNATDDERLKRGNQTNHPTVKEQLIFITGASENHAGVLEEFFEHHGVILTEPPAYKVVVIDLGLKPTSRIRLENMTESYASWMTINFSIYPPHVDINVNVGEYAWKPLSMELVSDHYDGSGFLWLDSGVRISNRSSLDKSIEFIRQHGWFTAADEGGGTTERWVHQRTRQYLWPNISETDKKIFLQKQMGSGGINGYTREKAKSFLKALYVPCALEKGCIAPPGSSRKNHRQDQSVMTTLLYREFGLSTEIPWFDEFGLNASKSWKEPQARWWPKPPKR